MEKLAGLSRLDSGRTKFTMSLTCAGGIEAGCVEKTQWYLALQRISNDPYDDQLSSSSLLFGPDRDDVASLSHTIPWGLHLYGEKSQNSVTKFLLIVPKKY